MMMRQPSAAMLAKQERRIARREQDARRGRLGRGRYEVIVGELSAVIRLAFDAGATGSLFGLEGPLRHAIRSDLCLQGWRWREADEMAREMLADAFRRVRAIRPSWNEGQLEWTIEAGTLIERTRCIRCHKPLPEGHWKFCSPLCGSNHNERLHRLMEAKGERAVDLAINSWT